FDTSTNVIVIAATNRPDILDPALLRPGRFDRRVILDTPDIRGRTAILEVHAKGKPFDTDVDLTRIARQTPGFSGADLANLINEAAILAARRNRKSIGLSELTEAIDRVIAGPARKSRVISQHEKELVAYHEAGHGLVAALHPHADPVHKISIVSRGRMGGYTRYLPEEDRYLETLEGFKADIATAMGGRVAEWLKFGEITTGASNDLEVATRIARQMVTRYGMSEKLGPRSFGKREEMVFLGRELGEQRDYSLRTEAIIDREVDRVLEDGRSTAETLIKGHFEALERISTFLLENETVDGDEVARLIRGEDPRAVAAKAAPAAPVAKAPEAAPAPGDGRIPSPKPQSAS
ncbi:MAG: AAA family ATPase, partial [Chloroflexi bacterium]|nr:AAA family ATPase [Chloroflexota bacterium]